MENYEVIGRIGTGSFGQVSKIRRRSDGRILVWKEIKYGKMCEREKQQLVTEVNILRELRHPNIVKYYDRIVDKRNSRIFIVMEFCEAGDLGQLIKRKRREGDYIPEETIWKIIGQVIVALHACHTRKEGKIIHRDIKPGNIFLDNSTRVKLGDFGLSRILGKDSVYAYTHVGTPYYMSPEQLTDGKYTEKSDVWSTGCILYEMASLHPPFEAKNQVQLAMKIKEGRFDRLPSRYSDDLNRTIAWMLNTQFVRRPGMEDLMKVPQIAAASNPRVAPEKIRVTTKEPLQQPAPIPKPQPVEEVKTAVIAPVSKEEELRAREEKLRQLEEDYKIREARLRAKEDEMAKREAAVQKRELEVERRAVSRSPITNRGDKSPRFAVPQRPTRPLTADTATSRSPLAERKVSADFGIGEKPGLRGVKSPPRLAKQGFNKENVYPRPKTAVVSRKKPNFDEINRYIAGHKKVHRRR